MSLNKNKFKYIGINLMLFAVLYLSVTFNKEFIRPVYGSTPFLGILTGSFPNFMATFIISLFPLAPLFAHKTGVKKSRRIFYLVAMLVFFALTIEEIRPFADTSKVYDIYDILANALGILLAIFIFEILVWLKMKHETRFEPKEK